MFKKTNRKQIPYQASQVETYCNCIQFKCQSKIGECGRWIPESINSDMLPNL